MATYNSDGSLVNVQSLHDGSAVDGDTITIPTGGSFTWSDRLTLTKNITLQGGSMFDGVSKTTINGPGGNGVFIEWTTNDSDFTAILKNIEFHWDNPSGGSQMIKIGGTARVRLSGGAWKGGFRITSCRFNVVDPLVNLVGQFFILDDWVTGVMDHCWCDLPYNVDKAGSGAGIIDINHASAPGFNFATTDITDGDGKTYKPQLGQNSYAREYIWGAGPFPVDGTGITGGNGDWDAFYMEDNIFCKRNIGITNTDVGGASKGGGRMVVRHNAMWCLTGGHEWSGSGGDASGYICESYNNYMRTPQSTSFNPHNLRGGAHVFYNERYEGAWNDPSGIAGVQIDRLLWQNYTGQMIGVADGTNFFDLNARGTLSANTYSFPAVSTPADTRIGSVYAEAGQAPGAVTNTKISSTSYVLLGLEASAPASKWVGFSIRNVTQGAPASLGCQTNAYQVIACAAIATSGVGTAGGDVTVTLTGGFGSVFVLNPTDRWELRYITKAMGVSGGTLIPMMNGKKSGTTGQSPLFLSAIGGLNPNWCDQRPDGDWQWSNKYRVLGGSTWTNCGGFDLSSGALSRLVLGGKHNAIRDIANAGSAHVTYDYPRQSNTTDSLRIGPDWDSGTFGTAVNPDTATQAYGAVYPHPLVTPPSAPTGKIIVLTGDLAYGNVIIGEAPTKTLTVANAGDASLVVSSIAYTPAVFSGSTSGFTVAPGSSNNVSVTFTPVAETTSNGTITVSSNADSGINTKACSGTGVAPAGGGGKGKGHKKGVLSRRA